ncbi:restriction endonuclease subunit S [Streptomyces sp. NPDC052225]|uniref:restriction endonuclease subunit S n=1 Tax=Streptomyces sp. NPDC052225 TaxID=3154949 RepID=UPI00342D72D2
MSKFTNENTKITSAIPNRIANLWLEPGDILIQRSNTPELVGTSALYNGPREWAIYPDLLIRVRVNSHLLPAFTALALQSKTTRTYFRSSAKGLAGSMPKIDQTTIENTLIPVPPLDVQQKVVTEVHEEFDRIDRLAPQLVNSITRARSLRASVLRYAFTGKLVPQDSGDEPSSELLTRIKIERATQAKQRRTRPAPASKRHKNVATSDGVPPPAASSTPVSQTAVQQEFEL